MPFKNKEDYYAYRKRYEEGRRESQKEYMRERYRLNRESILAKRRAKRAEISSNTSRRVPKELSSAFISGFKARCICEMCGYDGPSPLNFHHTDPKSKSANVGSISSVASFLNEVSKCVVLCANCHGYVHKIRRSRGLNA